MEWKWKKRNKTTFFWGEFKTHGHISSDAHSLDGKLCVKLVQVCEVALLEVNFAEFGHSYFQSQYSWYFAFENITFCCGLLIKSVRSLPLDSLYWCRVLCVKNIDACACPSVGGACPRIGQTSIQQFVMFMFVGASAGLSLGIREGLLKS